MSAGGVRMIRATRAKLVDELREVVRPPTMTKRQGDDDDARIAIRWRASQVAHEFFEVIIDLQFIEDQRQ